MERSRKKRGDYQIPESTWKWIKAANSRNLKILLTINGGNPLYKDPYDQEGFTNFARYVAKELKGHVQAIEIINEPFGRFRESYDKTFNTTSKWNGWDLGKNKVQTWPIKYLNIMNSAADAINEAAPGSYKIVGLGNSPALNKILLRQGVSKNLSGITLHPYSKKLPPEWIPYGNTLRYKIRDGEVAGDESGSLISVNQDLLETSKRYSGPKELWLTEQGYTTFNCPKNCKNSYANSTEEQQAIYAQRRLLENIGSGVTFSSWYNFYDKGPDKNNSEHNFGIMRQDGTLKPAYYAIQRMTKITQELKPSNWGAIELTSAKEQKTIPASAFRAYEFINTKNGKYYLALWSTNPAHTSEDKPENVNIKITAQKRLGNYTKLDLMSGEEKTAQESQNGNQTVLNNFPLSSHVTVLSFETME